MAEVWLAVVLRRCPGAGAAWLCAALAALEPGFERARFLGAYAALRRRLGSAPLEPSAAEQAELAAVGAPLPPGLALDELGRALLLLRAVAALPPAEHADFVRAVYRQADSLERRALLRALPHLPEPARFADVAIDACRSSVGPVFESVACDNAYADRFFPELHFNQLVLKALFTGVPVARIVGLERHLTPALARMAADYAAERRAAGRPVSSDVEHIARSAGSLA